LAVELSRWQSRFREHLQLRQFAPGTLANYTAELAPFFAFLESHGLTSLGEVTRSLVEDYRTHLFYATNAGTDPKKHAQRLSVGTQARRLSAVKAFLRYLLAEGYLVADPAAGVALPRTPQDLPRALLSEEETERLLEAPDVGTPLGLRDRAILEVLYGTGIRNGELVALTLEAVDLTRHELRIHRGKGDKSRVVPLGEEAEGWLEAYLATGRPHLLGQRSDPGAVFLSWRGHPLRHSAVCALVVAALQAAGLEKKITPHGLRHGCATHMLRHGAGLRHLQALLGHEQVNTTQRYLQIEVTDLREVMNRCHPRERDPEPE
jgi:integrase/recombinase XerD